MLQANSRERAADRGAVLVLALAVLGFGVCATGLFIVFHVNPKRIAIPDSPEAVQPRDLLRGGCRHVRVDGTVDWNTRLFECSRGLCRRDPSAPLEARDPADLLARRSVLVCSCVELASAPPLEHFYFFRGEKIRSSGGFRETVGVYDIETRVFGPVPGTGGQLWARSESFKSQDDPEARAFLCQTRRRGFLVPLDADGDLRREYNSTFGAPLPEDALVLELIDKTAVPTRWVPLEGVDERVFVTYGGDRPPPSSAPLQGIVIGTHDPRASLGGIGVGPFQRWTLNGYHHSRTGNGDEVHVLVVGTPAEFRDQLGLLAPDPVGEPLAIGGAATFVLALGALVMRRRRSQPPSTVGPRSPIADRERTARLSSKQRAIVQLLEGAEMDGAEIARALSQSPAAVAGQLATLVEQGLVSFRQQGQRRVFSVSGTAADAPPARQRRDVGDTSPKRDPGIPPEDS
ncbi:helix-turn-helix transcriptional regulator [bacterium]|nr:helix-turn-helix transcriptional regulator [bacterium]